MEDQVDALLKGLVAALGLHGALKIVDDRQELFDGVRLGLRVDGILLLDGALTVVVVLRQRPQQPVGLLLELFFLLLQFFVELLNLLLELLCRKLFGRRRLLSILFLLRRSLRRLCLCLLRLVFFFLFLRHVYVPFSFYFKCLFALVDSAAPDVAPSFR